jgi:hypothetical protein
LREALCGEIGWQFARDGRNRSRQLMDWPDVIAADLARLML